MTVLRFVTLGPPEGNHGFVLERHLRLLGLEAQAQCLYVDDFHTGARLVLSGEADHLLQCAAHPAHAEIVGSYRKTLRIVEAFVSASRPMALLASRTPGQDVRGTVAVQPATQTYADLSSYARVLHEPTVAAVGSGLVAGRYAAGIAFASLASDHPSVFEVREDIAPVVDAWVLFAASTSRGAAGFPAR